MDGALTHDMNSEEWSPLVDLSHRPIAGLFAVGDGALSRAARRVISSLDDPDGIISAFQSFTS